MYMEPELSIALVKLWDVRCSTPLYAEIPDVIKNAHRWTYPCMEIPDIINIKPISGLYAHMEIPHVNNIMPISRNDHIYGHNIVMNPYDLIKHWRSIRKDVYATSPFRAHLALGAFY